MAIIPKLKLFTDKLKGFIPLSIKPTVRSDFQPAKIETSKFFFEGLKETWQERLWLPKKPRKVIEKIGEFLKPESPEEAMKMGLIPVGDKFIDPLAIGGMKMVKKKGVAIVTKALRKFKSAEEVSEFLQKRIDIEIDKGISFGLSFDKAKNTSTVRRLFEARFKVDEIDIQKIRKELFNKIPASNKIKNDIIERQLQIREKGTILAITRDNFQRFLKDTATVKKDLLDDILNERNLDINILNPRVSGLEEEARKKLAKELSDEVNAIYDSVSDILVGIKPVKLTESQLSEIFKATKEVKPPPVEAFGTGLLPSTLQKEQDEYNKSSIPFISKLNKSLFISK